MSFFFFYNPRKPRSFEHKPIYYNPEKEVLQSRLTEEKKSSIKGNFIKGTTHLKKRNKKFSYRTIFASLIVFLVFIFFFAFVYYSFLM